MENVMNKLLKLMAIIMIVLGLPITSYALTNADDLVGTNGWIYDKFGKDDTVSTTEEYSLSSKGYRDNNYNWIDQMDGYYQSIQIVDTSITKDFDSVFVEFTSDNDYDSIPIRFTIGNTMIFHNPRVKLGKNVLKHEITMVVGQISFYLISDRTFSTTINDTLGYDISKINIYFHSKNESVSIVPNKRKSTNRLNNLNIYQNHININYNGRNILGNR